MKKRKKKKPADSAESIDRFERLCQALAAAGIQMRVEPGNFRGGFCLVDGDQELLFVNKKHSAEQRIALILEELKRRELLENVLPEALISELSDAN